jgi:hypothetical protein
MRRFGISLLLALTALAPAAAAAVNGAEPVQKRIARFNQSLAQEPPAWRQEPMLLALLWAGPAAGSERSVTYRAEPAEAPLKAWVVVTEEGLLDDAVAGSRSHFSFQLKQGRWELIDVKETWRCRRGPRTTGYTPEFCP